MIARPQAGVTVFRTILQTMVNHLRRIAGRSSAGSTQIAVGGDSYRLGLCVACVFFVAIAALPSAVQAKQHADTSGTEVVSIKSTPSGAKVFLDSTYYGETPLDILIATSRRRLLELRKIGYISRRVWVPVGRGTIAFDVALAPDRSWLSLSTYPKGVVVSIDGAESVSTQGKSIKVSPGKHWLTFEDSRRSVRRLVWFDPGDTVSLSVKLGVRSYLPLLCSAIVPGWGQLYDRSYFTGAGFMALSVGLAYFFIRTSEEYGANKTAYGNSYNAYLQATTEATAAETRIKSMSELNRMNSLAVKANVFGGALALVYAANLVDVWLFHLHDDIVKPVGKGAGIEISPILAYGRAGSYLGISLRF